jgi:hypothetical protein
LSDIDGPAIGTIVWTDLTVPDAGKLRDFYSAVVGWRAESVEMEGYSDFSMLPLRDDQPEVGVCHARGVNADLPAQWLIYIAVADIDASVTRCLELGGALVAGPRELGHGRFCVIRDPAGAVAALYQAED